MKFVVFSAILAFIALSTIEASSDTVAHREATSGEFHFDGHEILLPLINNSMHPKVSVDLGDGKQYEFIVDTGASVNVLDTSIAQALGYKVVGETEIGAPGGMQIHSQIVSVPQARVGDATIQSAEFVTMDIYGFSSGTTHGVLGLPLFKNYLLTFNLANDHIRVTRGSLSAKDATVNSYQTTGVHISVDIDVAGTTVASHIDTGSMGGFTLPAELKDQLPLQESLKPGMKAKLVGGERDIQFGKLDGAVTFAGNTYKDPDVAFMDPSPGAGNIGGRVLEDFIMTIDQRQHLIEFEKIRASAKTIVGESPRRVGLIFRGFGGQALSLAGVETGSMAEKAGLKSGDTLVRLNNKPMDQYDMHVLGALFKSTEPLKFEIERDGTPMSMEIQ